MPGDTRPHTTIFQLAAANFRSHFTPPLESRVLAKVPGRNARIFAKVPGSFAIDGCWLDQPVASRPALQEEGTSCRGLLHGWAAWGRPSLVLPCSFSAAVLCGLFDTQPPTCSLRVGLSPSGGQHLGCRLVTRQLSTQHRIGPPARHRHQATADHVSSRNQPDVGLPEQNLLQT